MIGKIPAIKVFYEGRENDVDQQEIKLTQYMQVAPLFEKTRAFKCWAKWSSQDPIWRPCVMVANAPASKIGLVNLRAESTVYVNFLSSATFAGQYW